jgi:hypothetical protein
MMHREYFSIIFNVKKCTLYSIKYGKSYLDKYLYKKYQIMLILFSGPEDKSGARQISLNVIKSFAWRVLVGGGRKAGAGGISTTLHRLVPHTTGRALTLNSIGCRVLPTLQLSIGALESITDFILVYSGRLSFYMNFWAK